MCASCSQPAPPCARCMRLVATRGSADWTAQLMQLPHIGCVDRRWLDPQCPLQPMHIMGAASYHTVCLMYHGNYGMATLLIQGALGSGPRPLGWGDAKAAIHWNDRVAGGGVGTTTLLWQPPA